MQEGTVPGTQERQHHARFSLRWQRLRDALASDWRGTRVFSFGMLLLVVSSLIVVAYYLNHPSPETTPDTPTYVTVTQHIMSSGNPFDPMRTPGYPLFIALIWLVSGSGNLEAVSVAQGALFVLATLELYALAWLIWKRAWIGLVVGLVTVSNTYLLSYVKPVIVEGLSFWLVVSLALASVWFVQRVGARRLWLVAALLLASFLARPEWVYLPPLLLGFLLFIAARRQQFRRLLPHALAAVVVLYGLLGLFIYENATQYGYNGITVIQSINLLGKVMQYNMQDEAPPQYADVTKHIDAFLAGPLPRGRDPYVLADDYPAISQNDWALAGNYALAVVEAHPIEFVWKSLPSLFILPTGYYAYSQLNTAGPFGWPLYQLQRVSRLLYLVEWSFIIWALGWLALLLWKRTTRQPAVEAMSALVLIALYKLFLLGIGAYVDDRRLRSPIEPVIILIVWGSLLGALSWRWQRHLARKARASARLQRAAQVEMAARDTTT